MKLSTSPQNLNNLNTLQALVAALSPWVTQVTQGINNPQLTMTDNLQLQIITVTFGSANTSVTTTHGLSVTPKGYILIGATAAMSIFAGTGTTNSSQISLQSSAAGKATVLLF